jgi:predicted Rdx family selenoprotein
MKANQGAQFEISIDGVARTYRDKKDIALQSAQLLKSRNPNRLVKKKDLWTGEETMLAFKPGE